MMRKRIAGLIALTLVLAAGAARAQYTQLPAAPYGSQLRTEIDKRFGGAQEIDPKLGTATKADSYNSIPHSYAELSDASKVSQANGAWGYCRDCQQTTVCVGGGSGASWKRVQVS